MKKSFPNIGVLLATYNSSKFLREQLDSLFSQSLLQWTLYIHDDGSNDNTLNIIDDYQSRHGNIVLMNDPQKGRGAKGSFMWMLENVSADYYMFCDHDDVWLPEKVSKTLELMIAQTKQTPLKPIIVCSDLFVVDQDLKTIHPSFREYMRLSIPLLMKEKYLVSCNFITGCTMMINQAAKDLALPIGEKALMHDSWIGLKVLHANGKIVYQSKPLTLYRQHGNNECGAKKIGGLRYYISKLTGIGKVFSTNYENYLMAHEATGVSWLSFFYNRIVYLFNRKNSNIT